jgi:hypothetical protein
MSSSNYVLGRLISTHNNVVMGYLQEYMSYILERKSHLDASTRLTISTKPFKL